ncbi:MAG: hypothetical protein ACJ72H_18115 [Candidatus Sulfotelmatobacter sp.]|jgi:hypothetical protein
MNDVPLFPLWLTVLVYIWALIGPLAGILIGHYMVRSWERRRWLADNQKEEYRRVLTALNRMNNLVLVHHNSGKANHEELTESLNETTLAFNTCIFTMEFLRESQVMGGVMEALTKLDKGGSLENYQKEYWKAINLILSAAKKSAL